MAVIGTPWTVEPHAHLGVDESGDFELCNFLEPEHLIGRASAHAEAIAEDLSHRTHLERLVAEDVSWHAAMRDQARAATISALQAGEKRRQVLAQVANSNQPTAGAVGEHDARLLAAYSVPALATINAQATHHSQQMQTGIKALLDIRARHLDSQFAQIFADEDGCRAFLVEWQQRRAWSCPKCTSTERYFLTTRDVFACRCGRQFSLRYGTIYLRSRMPLRQWFTIVAQVLLKTDVNASELARHLGVARKTTVRQMVKEVRAALAAADAEQQLAGLPQAILLRASSALRGGSESSLARY